MGGTAGQRTTEIAWGAADTSAGQVKALEVLTGATDSPQFDGIWRRIGITFSICEMTSLQIGGGDVHTVGRPGADVPKGHFGGQEIDDLTALGRTGRARLTLTYGLDPVPGPRYNSNRSDAPIRRAILNAQTMASNGPIIGVAFQKAAPSTTPLAQSQSGYDLSFAWRSSTYGDPTGGEVTIGQRVNPSIKADCGDKDHAYQDDDCNSFFTLNGRSFTTQEVHGTSVRTYHIRRRIQTIHPP